jgi:hypothetical protein
LNRQAGEEEQWRTAPMANGYLVFSHKQMVRTEMVRANMAWLWMMVSDAQDRSIEKFQQ